MKAKHLLFVFLIALNIQSGFSQSVAKLFKYNARNKQIILGTKQISLDVEGYDGDDLIIEPVLLTLTDQLPEEFKGFKLITRKLPADDIIKPIILKEDPGVISISIPESNCRKVRIRVPKNAHLNINFNIQSFDDKVSLKNLTGELELHGSAQVIELDNITGPLTLAAGADGNNAGATELISLTHLNFKSLTNDAANRFSFNIISNRANVDISLPITLKATVQVDCKYGELYTDLPLKQDAKSDIKGKYSGTLNGGGDVIAVNSVYGNVFMREQK